MKSILFAIILFACPNLLVSQTYFYDNVDNGLSKFICYDGNGISSLVIAPATLSKASKVRSNLANSSSYSISSDTFSGTSNNWLVTASSINIPQSGLYLVWKASSINASRDGYKVCISSTGNKVADFTTDPVFSIVAENVGFVTHSVDLSAYAGKNIYIAFVNNNSNKNRIQIDDIFVGKTSYTVLNTNPLHAIGKKAKIAGVLKNTGCTMTEFTAKYISNGQTFTKTYTNLTLPTGGIFPFEFNDSLTILDSKQPQTYSLEISAGTEIKTIKSSVTSVSFIPTKKNVFEEGTGTWCSGCPEGTVVMKNLLAKYPNLIGIVGHVNDPMENASYSNGLAPFLNGVPSGVINRKRKIDWVSDAEGILLTAQTDPAPASIALSGIYTDATKSSIKLTTTTVFNTDYAANANFKIGFVVTENNVKGTTAGYNQSNDFANNSNGVMGGFELLPNPVPAARMVYNEVARLVAESYTGIAGSVPTTISKDQALSYTYTLTLPATILNKNELEIVALLIDGVTGEIKNANSIKSSTLGVTAVESVNTSSLSAKVVKMESAISVDVQTESVGYISLCLYSVDGKQLYSKAVSNLSNFNFLVPSNALKGVYIVSVKTADGSVERKIIL